MTGACIGSFLYLAGMRTVAGGSILRPRSHCDECGQTLSAPELVPILSYIALRGHCKRCKSKIGINSTITEILTGLVLLLFFMRLETSLSFVVYSLLFCMLLLMALIDLATQNVYDGHLLLLGLFVLMKMLLLPPEPFYSVFPGIIAWGVFSVLVKEKMGDGDKLLIGLLLLLFPPNLQLRLFLYSIWSAALIAVFLLCKGADRKMAIPFVPFIAAGYTLVILLHGGLL